MPAASTSTPTDRPNAGKVAVIAGASRGIGAATALAFARWGAAVAIAARDLSALEAVAAQIQAEGGQALAVRTDVGDSASVQQLIARMLDRFGRLDIAFNNATDGPMPAPLAELDDDQFDLGIRANIRGTFLGTNTRFAPCSRAAARSSTWHRSRVCTESAASLHMSQAKPASSA